MERQRDGSGRYLSGGKVIRDADIQCRLPSELKAFVRQTAEARGQGISDFLERLILAERERAESGEPSFDAVFDTLRRAVDLADDLRMILRERDTEILKLRELCNRTLDKVIDLENVNERRAAMHVIREEVAHARRA